MSPEFRPNLTWLLRDQAEHWNLLRLVMRNQFEAIRKQSLHHLAHLVFSWIRIFGPRPNVKTGRDGPLRQLLLQGMHLICVCDLVSEDDVNDKR